MKLKVARIGNSCAKAGSLSLQPGIRANRPRVEGDEAAALRRIITEMYGE